MPVPDVTEYAGLLPSSADPATFSARAEAIFAWLAATATPEFNAAIAALNAALNADETLVDAVAALQALVSPPATPAEYQGNDPDKTLTTDGVWGAADYVTLVDGATIALDLSTGINFEVTITDDRTIGAPTNGKPGQAGIITVIQGGAGGWSLSFNAAIKHPRGVPPVLSSAAGSEDDLQYRVRRDGSVIIGPASMDVS